MKKGLETRNRFIWIDALKGIAAIFVMLVHFWEKIKDFYNPIINSNFIYRFMDSITIKYIDIGNIGINIFFIISGYLIANVFKKKNVKQFIWGKFKRLYPVYWLSIILSLLLIQKERILDIAVNITMFQRFFGIKDIVGAYWTLQIDIIFYIFCICLFFIKRFFDNKFINIVYYCLLISSILFSVSRYFFEKSFPVGIVLFISLSLIGLMVKRNEEKKIFNMKLNIFLFIITLIVSCLFAYSDNFNNIIISIKYINSYLIAISLFFIIKRIKCNKNIFSIVGEKSYSIYLLHPTIGFFVMRSLYENNVNIFLAIILSMIATYLSAWLTHYFIERKIH